MGQESIVLRPVGSEEAMTANFFMIPFDKLERLTKNILAMPEISALFYDVTNKPPGTIEWE
jgi:GMP synthase (glutamine-hydrolysing)